MNIPADLQHTQAARIVDAERVQPQCPQWEQINSRGTGRAIRWRCEPHDAWVIATFDKTTGLLRTKLNRTCECSADDLRPGRNFDRGRAGDEKRHAAASGRKTRDSIPA